MQYGLRDHQSVVRAEIEKHARNGKRRVLVSAPTGFGKTILSFDIIRSGIEKGSRILFTAHRITLAEQSYEKFKALSPEYLQGENKLENPDYKLLVATLQTLMNYDIKEPTIVIIDEVHYAYDSKMVQSLFEKFPKALFIGLSATPVDDKDYLLDGWDAMVDNYQTQDLIEMGWLTPFKVFTPMKIDRGLLRISDSSNDFIEKSLEEAVNTFDINKSIVNNYINLGENRQFIAFAVNTSHCSALKAAFAEAGIHTEVIVATTSKKRRDDIFEKFSKGEIKGLISIEILTTGFDEPSVSCVIMATATNQWKKYIQCCGRGIRLLGNSIQESIANGKSDCILLDCCGNVEEHGMPSDRKVFMFGKKISRVLDRELKLTENLENRLEVEQSLTVEKEVYLKKIGKLLDLYEGKVYFKESELQEDVNRYLKKTGYFWWRQNSGKAYIQGRWVHFASVSGLPDNSVFFKKSSIFFGVELKLPTGRLTPHQKQTLPFMIANGVLVFICESVLDLYKVIEHVERNTVFNEEGVMIKHSIHKLPQRQIDLRKKLNLPLS